MIKLLEHLYVYLPIYRYKSNYPLFFGRGRGYFKIEWQLASYEAVDFSCCHIVYYRVRCENVILIWSGTIVGPFCCDAMQSREP